MLSACKERKCGSWSEKMSKSATELCGGMLQWRIKKMTQWKQLNEEKMYIRDWLPELDGWKGNHTCSENIEKCKMLK